jgi:hypothetical protein
MQSCGNDATPVCGGRRMALREQTHAATMLADSTPERAVSAFCHIAAAAHT